MTQAKRRRRGRGKGKKRGKGGCKISYVLSRQFGSNRKEGGGEKEGIYLCSILPLVYLTAEWHGGEKRGGGKEKAIPS